MGGRSSKAPAIRRWQEGCTRSTWGEGAVAISIAAAFVDYVQECFAFAVTLELLQEKLHGALQPIRRVIGTVRRKQHVFQGVEGMSVGQRLGVEDVRSEEHTSELQSL